jgi:glycosyltransferase involved in cell wall biosynthesis
MSDIPAVSVIIPLYNKGAYITRALNSVLFQTFHDFEVIVVDDGSTDNGAEIVREFRDLRIRLIQQENRGVSAARNRGVSEARAELIASLDADDEWMPKHLETIIRLRDKFIEAGAYTTSYVIQEQNGQIRKPDYKAIPQAPWEGIIPRYFLSAALSNYYPVNSSVLCVKREVFFEMGGYPLDKSYGEDADLWGKIAIHYPIAFSWEIGAIYHWDDQNRACIKIFPLEKNPIVISGQEAIMNDTVPQEMIEDLVEYINKIELGRAQRNILVGRSTQAREILLHCNTKLFKKEKILLYMMALIPLWIYKEIRRLKRYFVISD